MNKHPNYNDCLNDDDCTYQEPHVHGFACDKQCPCRKGGHARSDAAEQVSGDTFDLLPLSRTQRFKNVLWRWRARRAFDARDQHEPGSSAWFEADKKVERLFQS